jgi:hypothetical protein
MTGAYGDGIESVVGAPDGTQPTPALESSHDPELDYDDVDSAFDEESQYTDTQSMRSSIMRFREENGRTFHAYGKKV